MCMREVQLRNYVNSQESQNKLYNISLQKLKVTLTNKCSYLSCIHLLSYTLDMSKMCRMFMSVSFSL